MAWEDYFRQHSVAEVNQLVRSLDSDISKERSKVHEEIGVRHVEVIALAHRLDSLRLLVREQENHLSAFARSEQPGMPSFNRVELVQSTTGLSNAATIASSQPVLGRIDDPNRDNKRLALALAGLAERSIVLKRYTLATRTLYLADALQLSSFELSRERERLHRRLSNWARTATHISQDYLHACMINGRLSSSQWVAEFLVSRYADIEKLLAKSSKLVAALQVADTSLFIYDQVTADMSQWSLSQRKIIDLPEFGSKLGIIPDLLRARQNDVLSIKVFPSQCYDDKTVAESNSFLSKVSSLLESATKKELHGVSDATSMISELSGFISQAQHALSNNDVMGKLLAAYVRPFIRRFFEVATEMTALPPISSSKGEAPISAWTSRVKELKNQVSQIFRLSKTSSSFAPETSKELETLYTSSTSLLNEKVESVYKRERAEVLSVDPLSLEDAKNAIEAVTRLDRAFSSLGGEPLPNPYMLFTSFARLLVETWKDTRSPKRNVMGSQSFGALFEIQLLLDDILSEEFWSPSLLDSIRPIAESELRVDHSGGTAPVSKLVAQGTSNIKSDQSNGGKSDEILESPRDTDGPVPGEASLDEESPAETATSTNDDMAELLTRSRLLLYPLSV